MGLEPEKAVLVNTVAILVLSMPCVLGFNLWSGFQPLGAGTSIMDLEDFLVSDNILPLGSLVYLLFCVTRKGWGWDNFLAEANTGSGLRFPRNVRFYVTFLLPIIMFIIFVMGYWNRFFAGALSSQVQHLVIKDFRRSFPSQAFARSSI